MLKVVGQSLPPEFEEHGFSEEEMQPEVPSKATWQYNWDLLSHWPNKLVKLEIDASKHPVIALEMLEKTIYWAQTFKEEVEEIWKKLKEERRRQSEIINKINVEDSTPEWIE